MRTGQTSCVLNTLDLTAFSSQEGQVWPLPPQGAHKGSWPLGMEEPRQIHGASATRPLDQVLNMPVFRGRSHSGFLKQNRSLFILVKAQEDLREMPWGKYGKKYETLGTGQCLLSQPGSASGRTLMGRTWERKRPHRKGHRERTQPLKKRKQSNSS